MLGSKFGTENKVWNQTWILGATPGSSQDECLVKRFQEANFTKYNHTTKTDTICLKTRKILEIFKEVLRRDSPKAGCLGTRSRSAPGSKLKF